MKIRHLLAIVGLAIGFAVPVLAQEKDSVDPKIAEQLGALNKKTDEGYNKGDAAALATLYTASKKCISLNISKLAIRALLTS